MTRFARPERLAVVAGAIILTWPSPTHAYHCRPGLIYLRHAHQCIPRASRSLREASRRAYIDEPKTSPPVVCPEPSPPTTSPLGWPDPWVESSGLAIHHYWSLQ